MFKVSFKENKQFPVKRVQRNNYTRETIVTLKGVVQLPEFLQCFIPPKIWDWIDTCKNVQAGFSMTKMHLTIKGKAKRSESDTDDPVLGERIAEARAKINLYKFMVNFCWKLHLYYINISFGGINLIPDGVYANLHNPDCIVKAAIKYTNLYGNEKEHLNKLLVHEPDTESPSQS